MSTKKPASHRFKEIRNSRISRNFFVDETFETGIVLTGTEVKSIRLGNAQISEAFARIEKGEVMLYHAHVSEYFFGTHNNHDPYRPRKLLLHRRQIRKLEMATQGGGRALIPKRIYFRKGLIKVELALSTGKKLYDKREDLKKRTALREAEKEMKYRR